ncbi:dynein heavy chain 8, axonemal [Caerostris extrusa]|uniref:Dynein heavy chain 8, axonemal n=1 Tax=Caerostris extrusa TaxID=172846 RepID=A0AAV4PCU9_CAEEX|nr:dynein heavy chain 8, axonemal [Caerostris extrusa]
MSSGAFLNSLFTFPKDNINEEMVELMEPYITMPDYSLESALKTCGQVAGLLSWTLAMASFFAVNKEVLPLKANLGLLEVQNAKASKELAIAQAELDEKQAELDVVNAIYNEAMAKKQDLQDTAETCKRKMIAAEALIAGLQGEKERWTEDSKKRFQSQINRIPNDALYSLAKRTRNSGNIPLTEDLNLIDALTDALLSSPLIEDVGEELDPVLDNVLDKNFVKSGTILKVTARTSVIDFTVTMKGLEDQLLGRGDLLVDDESLIEVLKTTKETAADVAKQLDVADATNKMINLAREEYRPVASRGSILYFLICDMAMVNVMYQTSLVQFLGIFDLSLERYTCRGLYEIHKFLFTLLLTIKIDLSENNITHEEFGIFIKGGAALDLKAVEPKTCRWVTDVTWLNLVALTKLDYFKEILVKVKRSEKLWKAWYEKDAPEEEVIPDGYDALNSFQKLLLLRSWCPDRTLAQARSMLLIPWDNGMQILSF